MSEINLYAIFIENIVNPAINIALTINVSFLLILLFGSFMTYGELDYIHFIKANKYIRNTTLLSLILIIVKIFIMIA